VLGAPCSGVDERRGVYDKAEHTICQGPVYMWALVADVALYRGLFWLVSTALTVHIPLKAMEASSNNNPGAAVVYVNIGPYPQPASPVGPGRHQEPPPAPRGSKFHVLVDRTVYVAGEPVQGRLSAQVQADWAVQSVAVTVAGVQRTLLCASECGLAWLTHRSVPSELSFAARCAGRRLARDAAVL